MSESDQAKAKPPDADEQAAGQPASSWTAGTHQLSPSGSGRPREPIPGPSLKDRIRKLAAERAELSGQPSPPPLPDDALIETDRRPREHPDTGQATAVPAPTREGRGAQQLEARPLSAQDEEQIKDQTGVRKAAKPSAEEDEAGVTPWQLIFQPATPDSTALALEVRHPMVVGRTDLRAGVIPDVDIIGREVDSHGVSRQHAILMPAADGLWLIDLDSTNGTWVNGLYLQPGTKYRLRSGDQVEFGSLKMLVRVLTSLTTPPHAEAGSGATIISRSKPRS